MPKTSLKAGSFADRVVTLREQQSLTATDLAKLANVTPAAVWNWEKNGITPRAATVNTIASKLGVTPEFLLNGDETVQAISSPRMIEFQPEMDLGSVLESTGLEDLIRAIEAKGFAVTIQSR
jgi:transcriptional regulator with XRE-family HTH domain